uniref:FkbM family methyltransferase n=1 Tax=Thermonema rossianum TaxID=55505 RepID=UPI00146F9D4A|nr:FkbM family methyltransferase [Thermonema rossianum]
MYKKDIQLQRLLIFVVACADKGYRLKLQGKEFIHVSGIGKKRNLNILVRKYTRDLLVFEGFFVSDDYQAYIEKIQKGKEGVKYIIDAGANIGCAALYLHSYFPDARIICIEPEISNFSLLKQNIAINHLEDYIKCERKALWNKITDLPLRRIDYSHDGFHVMEEGVTHEVIDQVKTCTVLELMDTYQVDVIGLLKIDIEGAEKVLLTDETHFLKLAEKTNFILLEVHQEHIAEDTAAACLQKAGFCTSITSVYGQPSLVFAYKPELEPSN